MTLKSLGERIKEIRKSKNINQSKLAEKIGYSDRSMITKIEQGKVDLSESKIIAIAEALGVSPHFLVGWEEEKPKVIHYDYYEEYDLSELSEKERIELDTMISHSYGMFMSRDRELSEHDKEELKRVLTMAFFNNRK